MILVIFWKVAWCYNGLFHFTVKCHMDAIYFGSVSLSLFFFFFCHKLDILILIHGNIQNGLQSVYIQQVFICLIIIVLHGKIIVAWAYKCYSFYFY